VGRPFFVRWLSGSLGDKRSPAALARQHLSNRPGKFARLIDTLSQWPLKLGLICSSGEQESRKAGEQQADGQREKGRIGRS